MSTVTVLDSINCYAASIAYIYMNEGKTNVSDLLLFLRSWQY